MLIKYGKKNSFLSFTFLTRLLSTGSLLSSRYKLNAEGGNCEEITSICDA
jgi:hypothetical protein